MTRTGALTVVGSFEPIARREDVERFVVDGEVLDTNLFGGRRCPSEQTALSIYRIARLRGWTDVARRMAGWVERRVAEADGLPVHDLLGRGESHTRFLADAALLLEAEGRSGPALLVHRRLDDLAAPGPWYRHDTVEAEAGENHLVLNTHVHTLVSRAACGLPIDAGLRVLDEVLRRPGERGKAPLQAALVGLADLLRAAPFAPLRERGWRLSEVAHHSAARSRVRSPHLALPGGWLARDALPTPTPSYLTVNLHDLSVLSRIAPHAVAARRALRRGIAWARGTGFLRAQRLAGDPLVVLAPVFLRDTRVAEGLDPCIGWPGLEDRLWPRLPAGTP